MKQSKQAATLAVAVLLVAAAQAQNQPNPLEFFAQVVRHQTIGENMQRLWRTHGVLVNHNHIVVPATGVRGFPREELRVYLQSNRLIESADVRGVEEIFEHEDFNPQQPGTNNIAVLRIAHSEADSDVLEPRNLGALTAVQCTIFGFPGGIVDLQRYSVGVTTVGCQGGAAFCTTFSVTGIQCDGFVGTPVICQNHAYVAGFSHIEASPVDAGQCVLAFHNIEPFHDWIRQVSGARAVAPVSVLVMALGVVLGKLFL